MRSARSALLAAAAACLLGLTATAVAAGLLEVCASGCAYSSIAAALEAAAEGDTVLVRAGTYREGPLVIDTPRVALVGEGWPVLDGELTHQVLAVEADRVVVRGLVLRDPGQSHVREDRKSVVEGKRVEIGGCRMMRNKQAG